ncbi:CtsR family transcriptional regulator [Christensenellaceae bacterium OttesenSCG-928-M15]|nr:CtsR family transcriptional regulator [Christensenellaceae bacterium OttesenSCG-928-M15]
MPVLSDSIESFIKDLFGMEAEIQLQRNALAAYFSCAPSQINYVLSTRFTLERGYMVVSRRGSGGCIRVVRVNTDKDSLLHVIACNMDDTINQREANNIVQRLFEQDLITAREAALILSGIDGCSMPTEQMQDAVRAKALKRMLCALMQCEEEE